MGIQLGAHFGLMRGAAQTAKGVRPAGLFLQEDGQQRFLVVLGSSGPTASNTRNGSKCQETLTAPCLCKVKGHSVVRQWDIGTVAAFDGLPVEITCKTAGSVLLPGHHHMMPVAVVDSVADPDPIGLAVIGQDMLAAISTDDPEKAEATLLPHDRQVAAPLLPVEYRDLRSREIGEGIHNHEVTVSIQGERLVAWASTTSCRSVVRQSAANAPCLG